MDDAVGWAKQLETAGNRVARTHLGASDVSTIFLGIDHSYGEGRPILFETMVFNGKLDGEQERCSTWDEAMAQHIAMCQRVKASNV